MQKPSDQQWKWAQQDLNLRPLGDHPQYHGVCHGVPDLRELQLDHAVVSPNIVGNSDGKVTADLGRRFNCLNSRVLLSSLASWLITAAVVAIVWWLS